MIYTEENVSVLHSFKQYTVPTPLENDVSNIWGSHNDDYV
jgi:hypothetical protein